MFPSFLPSQVKDLQELTSIRLAQNIQRIPISTSFYPKAIQTAYVHLGVSQTPLLLLHGFDSSLLEFCRIIPYLSNQYETGLIDLLGFGFTQRFPEINYNSESLKNHLYQSWKTLINRPVILVGASMGGATAIDFALTYPEIVKKLILIDSVGYSGSFPIGKLLIPPVDSMATEFWRQRKLQALNFAPFLNINTSQIEAIKFTSLHLEMPYWQEAMISFMISGGYEDLTPRISQVKQPTLILWGEKDETLGTVDAYRFHQNIVNSQLVWMKKCGHVPHLEQPELTANAILEFIDL
ncbi:MAG: alpha/beta hydrolase [Microcoleaceae cyanobacterium]